MDRAIGYVSPRIAAERDYYRAAQRMLPQLSGQTIQDDRPYPRAYERDFSDPQRPGASAIYDNSIQTRLDNYWPPSRSLHGFNAPLNRWRLTFLRDRSRELDRNNVLVTSMLDRAAENVIGQHGMRVRPSTDDEDFNKESADLFTEWMDEADITQQCGSVELQRLFHRSHLRDGDIGVNLVTRGQDSFVQAVEGDLIDTMNGGYDLAERVMNGIQVDADNRATAYYVLSLGLTGVQMTATPVDARNFVFYARRKNFTDIRGEPCFSQSLSLFDQIEGYKEAAVVAARIACCQSLFIKSKTSGLVQGLLQQQKNAQNAQQRVTYMEPGAVWRLQPDEEMGQMNPNQPGQNLPDFMAVLLRFAGLTIGLPLELVFLDFSRTTYSSARASLLQAYRTFRSNQGIFINRVMSRMYRWRISRAVKYGELKCPAAIRDTFWKHQWIAPGWAWIDPVKEIQAAMMEVDAGFNSVENINLERGRTMEETFDAKKRAADMLKKLNLEISKSAMTRDLMLTPGGVAAPAAKGGNDPAQVESPSDDLPENDE